MDFGRPSIKKNSATLQKHLQQQLNWWSKLSAFHLIQDPLVSNPARSNWMLFSSRMINSEKCFKAREYAADPTELPIQVIRAGPQTINY